MPLEHRGCDQVPVIGFEVESYKGYGKLTPDWLLEEDPVAGLKVVRAPTH